MRRAFFVMVVVAIVGVTLSACGGDSDDGHGNTSMNDHMNGHMGGDGDENVAVAPGARTIEVRAKSFSFSPKKLMVKAGEDVAIQLHSTDVFHDFVVKGKGHVVGAKRNKTEEGGLRIDEPGTYAFWCSVVGHRRAGMEGAVVVE